MSQCRAPVNVPTPTRFRDLPGLGPRSEEMLALIGIHTVEAFLSTDPYEVFARLRPVVPGLNTVAIYAFIGAQENRHWLDIKRERRGEILMRLDAMGLATAKDRIGADRIGARAARTGRRGAPVR